MVVIVRSGSCGKPKGIPSREAVLEEGPSREIGTVIISGERGDSYSLVYHIGNAIEPCSKGMIGIAYDGLEEGIDIKGLL